jgi:hypothetical protein
MEMVQNTISKIAKRIADHFGNLVRHVRRLIVQENYKYFL